MNIHKDVRLKPSALRRNALATSEQLPSGQAARVYGIWAKIVSRCATSRA